MAKVSWKTFVLEVWILTLKTFVLEIWILTFCESLVENARFGRLDSHFCRKSRGKRSFFRSIEIFEGKKSRDFAKKVEISRESGSEVEISRAEIKILRGK